MKFAAHPLIVAAAFGLLGPAALADDDKQDETRCDHCDCGAAALECSDIEDAPSAEDFARIEAEWQAAVVRLDATSGSWT